MIPGLKLFLLLFLGLFGKRGAISFSITGLLDIALSYPGLGLCAQTSSTLLASSLGSSLTFLLFLNLLLSIPTRLRVKDTTEVGLGFIILSNSGLFLLA